jgi:8-oxo-dGTP pyrophosphatase MutT (NUDIX family)
MAKPMSVASKVCPVVLRRKDGRVEILAFRHPSAGLQLVKGSLEPGEDAAPAALRELREESGIRDAEIVSFLGKVRVSEPDQEWHLFLCSTGPLLDAWSHFTQDGGGHEFSFFWYALEQEPDEQWHPIFAQALSFIRNGQKHGR